MERQGVRPPFDAASSTAAANVPAVPGEVAPRTTLEEAVAAIWAEVLALDEVSIHDDFFKSGGDSLRAVQAVARIESVLGLELPLHEIFEGPTAAQVAARLAAASVAGPPIGRASREEAIPLSWAQQRLWFIDQLEGANAAYNIREAVRLRGWLNRAALQAALDALIVRHESLRTIFARTDAGPFQKIVPEGCFDLQLIELQQLQSQLREEALLSRMNEEVAQTFDLSAGPLIRGCLFRLAEDEHVLLMVMHHIVSDGWSLGVLMREMGTLYEAFSTGGSDSLVPLPIQYADYALWQRQWLSGQGLQQQLAYWKKNLQGAPELLDLPTDRPRPAAKSYRGSSVNVSLDSTLTTDMRVLSRRLDSTLAMILMTAWSIVLGKLGGQKEVVIGMPVANRRRTELEGLIGFFVNSLAIRIQLEGDPTLAGLLARAKDVMLGAYAHQDVPFEKVVEELRPTRSLSHSPVFQVMFALQNAPRKAMQLSGLTLTDQPVSLRTTQFDLFLSLYEDGDRVTGILNYSTDLFDRGTIERWVGYLEAVLDGMARIPHVRISELELMRPDERRQVLEAFNATQKDYPQGKLIHELFEHQARTTPDVVAVTDGTRSMTYAELNGRANQLARYLRGKGVGADQMVALCFERGVEAIIAILGVLKSGGAYVPLDPSYPPERLKYMLQDSAPRVLLTQGRFRGAFGTTTQITEVDELWDEIAGWDNSDLDPRSPDLTARNLAYVIYTSGSTGEPKGVMVEHGGAINLWRAFEPAFAGCAAHARVTVNAGLAFDASVKMLVQLLSGRTLVVVPKDIRADAAALVEFARAQHIDVLDCTPSHLKSLLSQGLAEAHADNPRVVVVGGEAVSTELWDAASSLPERSVYNVYGPTECSVVAAMCEMEGGTPHIGRPLANVRIYILDEHCHPVPIGVKGEIHISGAGVARGYLNRPELTTERFVRDPFSSAAEGRMYKTGDVARWHADGTIEFVGRNDFQVKVRGYRIEPGEIETQLVRAGQVKDAVVIAREDVPGEQQLVAYVIGGDRGAPSADELRSALKAVLPEYMVPSAFVALERWPLTPNGKLDRRALPAPGSSAYATRCYEAPNGEIERALARVWSELLRVQRVGRHDNFFELGGHSLLATRVMSRIREDVLVDLPVRAIFDAPTVAELGERIQADERARIGRQSLARVSEALQRSIEEMDDQAVMARIAELERDLEDGNESKSIR